MSGKKSLFFVVLLFCSSLFFVSCNNNTSSTNSGFNNGPILTWTNTLPNTQTIYWSGIKVSNVTIIEVMSNTNTSTYNSGVYCTVTTNQQMFSPDDGSQLASIYINPLETFQTITGFGGAFTEAGASVLLNAPPSVYNSIVNMYFGPSAANTTFCRTHIGSCDFCQYSYCYDNVSNDINLSNFTIATDMTYLVPYISNCQALAGGPGSLYIFACPWQLPPWMMQVDSYIDVGNTYNPFYLPYYANYLVDYLRFYKNAGIPISMICAQNEPNINVVDYESCAWTAPALASFISNYLVPSMDVAGIKIPVMLKDDNFGSGDPSYWVSQSAAAFTYAGAVAVHWYNHYGRSEPVASANLANTYYNLTNCHYAYPDLPILMTEACEYNPSGPHIGDYNDAECVGNDILNCLNNWVCGWCYWNMVLNTQGGPNHVANYCSSPVEVNTNTYTIITNPSYFYLAAYSTSFRPYSKLILATSSTNMLQATGVVNTDANQTVAVVVLNINSEDVQYKLNCKGQIVKFDSPPHSIETLTFQ